MGKFLDVSAQTTSCRGIALSADGTKAYMAGDSGNNVSRYTLSTAWDISTGTFDTGQTLSTSPATSPRDIYLKSDGTKLYVMSNDDDNVRQYTLGTAYDLTSATDDGAYSVATQEAGPQGLTFNDDGDKMYVVGAVNKVVYEYDITTAWDITGTVTYNSNSHDVSAQVTSGIALFLGDSGTKLFASYYSDIHRYTLSTPDDITSAGYDTGQSFTFTEDAGNEWGTWFKPDGTELYVCNGGTEVQQYTLGTAWDLTTAAFTPPILADGDVTVAPTISATAISSPHADGDVTVTPTISATGRLTVHADGDVTVTPTISATASNQTLHTDGGVTITPTVSATGRGTIHADASVTLAQTIAAIASTQLKASVAVTVAPEITATGEVEVRLSGSMTMPALTADGYLEYQIVTLPALTATADMEQTRASSMVLPALIVEGTVVAGTANVANVTLPLLEVVAAGDNTANITLPALEVEGAMISSTVSTGTMTIPSLTIIAGAGNIRFLDADITLPIMTMTGASANSPIIDGDTALPLLSAFGVNAVGTASTGDVELPMFTMDSLVSAIISSGILTANITLPSLVATGYLQFTATLTHSGWVFNTESQRTSEYDNFDYLLVTNAFGKNIGVSDDGVYELTGDTDNTVDIAADVLFGFDSFRTEDLKRVKAVHVGYRADSSGDLNIQIIVDGEDEIREYSVKHVSSASGIKRGRATIAKGLKSRYWSYGIKNVAGADFLIDDLSVYVQQHNRKAQ